MAADALLILKTLNAGLAKYVLLNRDTNSSVRTKANFRLTPERDMHLDAPEDAFRSPSHCDAGDLRSNSFC